VCAEIGSGNDVHLVAASLDVAEGKGAGVDQLVAPVLQAVCVEANLNPFATADFDGYLSRGPILIE
jgi:hypothetical protein